jgi:hypothetical protein
MNNVLSSLKRINWLAVISLWTFVLLLFSVVVFFTWQAADSLGRPALISGYSLFASVIFLGFFKVRKHLSMLPLVPARFWFSMHSMIGVLAVLLYFLHVDQWWPDSGYVQLLAALMIAVSLTGMLGYLLEKIYPARLTQIDSEILFEKIPEACFQIREEVKKLLFEEVKNTGSGTLSRHYMESINWYFQRPRFIWSHIAGDNKADFWLKQQFHIVNRYLNDDEKEYSQRLEKLAFRKLHLDYQYAVQGLLKLWLLLHVPLSIMLLMMSVWHLLLVNIYSV